MSFAAVAVALLLLQAPAKGTIDGVVVNAVTGAPVAGAQVTLSESPVGVPGLGFGVGGGVTGVLSGMIIATVGGGITQAPPANATAPPPNRPPAPVVLTTD